MNATNKLSAASSVAICALALAIAGSSSPANAGPPKTALKHAPIRLIRDQNGNPVVADVTGPLESPNWSGYVLAKFQTHEKYKAIQATWTVPEVVFQGVDAASAQWVGIGGFCKNAQCKQKDIDRTLIQLGTAQEALGTSDLEYFAWYEMLPKAPVTTPLAVSPGDVITASLSCEGKCKGKAHWTLSFTNETTGDTFNQTVKYKSPNLSAEWIEEAPVSGDNVVPLADFGTATFSNGSVNGDAANLSNADSVVMLNPNGQTSNVSAPNMALDGFSVCFGDGSFTPCFDAGP